MSFYPSSVEKIVPSKTSSFRPSAAPSTSSYLAVNSTSVGKPDQETSELEPGPESLPAGGVAGIVLSSVFVLFAIAYIYSNKKRKREEDDPDLRDVRNKDLDDLEDGARFEKDEDGKIGVDGKTAGRKDDSDCEVAQVSRLSQVSENDVEEKDDDEEEKDETFIGTITDDSLKLSDISARPSLSLASSNFVAGVPKSPERALLHDDSSSAGESGWSSSAGLSSLNTSSFDNVTDDGLLPGSPDRILAPIGVAGAAAMAAASTQRDAKK